MSQTDDDKPPRSTDDLYDDLDVNYGDVFVIEANDRRYKVWDVYKDYDDHERIKLYCRSESHAMYLTPEQISEALREGRWSRPSGVRWSA